MTFIFGPFFPGEILRRSVRKSPLYSAKTPKSQRITTIPALPAWTCGKPTPYRRTLLSGPTAIKSRTICATRQHENSRYV